MESKNNYFNSIDLLGLLNRWKLHLAIVGVISLIASAIFSSPLFIKPKYKSEAVIYPSNLIAYSDESPTEQMLQICQSNDIVERMITSFDLYKHYNIDKEKDIFHHTHVLDMYSENVKIKKTEFESMEIVVMDTDPVVASRMVDSIIHFFNQKARRLQAEKSYEVMVISKNQLDAKQLEMDSMQTLLQNLADEHGLLDFKSQTKEISRAYFKNPNNKELKQMYAALREKGQDFNAINEHLWRVRGTYNDLKLVYENAKRDVTKQLTYANVITHPVPSDKKAYPVRWLIVLASVAGSVLVAFMVLLVMDSRKKLQKS